jgi:flagella basal body P-ring formation protein FlgA
VPTPLKLQYGSRCRARTCVGGKISPLVHAGPARICPAPPTRVTPLDWNTRGIPLAYLLLMQKVIDRLALSAGHLGVLLWLSSVATGAALAGAVPRDWQPIDSIQAAATTVVAASLREHEDVEITAVALDQRVKLPRCGESLSATIQHSLSRGQAVVAVSCAAPTPWRLFVPVRASFMVPVLVARESLSRGRVIAEQDVGIELRSAASLPYEYLTHPDDAVGRSLRRTLSPGAVVVPTGLEQPELVNRGQQVTLVAQAHGLIVKSSGTALGPAAKDQRVHVKTRSGRTVEGIVYAAGQVRVDY